MVYSQGEKERMALLLEMFQSFIREQSYFDIVYSEKLGYLRIVPGGEAADDLVFRISDLDELLRVLADDILFEQLRIKTDFNPSPEDFQDACHLFESKLPFSPEENRRCMDVVIDSLANWRLEEPFKN